MRVPALGALRCPFPGAAWFSPGRAGRRGRGEKAAPLKRVQVCLGPRGPAGLGVPRAAVLLPSACQLGPNLISVLSVQTPLKVSSAYHQQLSSHTTTLLPKAAVARCGAGLPAGLRTPFPGCSVLAGPSWFPRPKSGPRLGLRLSLPAESPGPFLGNSGMVESRNSRCWELRGHQVRPPTPRQNSLEDGRSPVPCSFLGCSQRLELPPSLQEAWLHSGSRPSAV